MVLNPLDPRPILDSDSFTVHSEDTSTPPESVADEPLDDHDPFDKADASSSSVPWPGSTFIISEVSSGHVLTLENGEIGLTLSPCGHGSVYWACVETNGWLGFRNTVSGKFLGHDKPGKLICNVDRHRDWENFCARMMPDGGYILIMTHWEELWYVGVVVEQGVEKLAKVKDRSSAIVWEFLEV